MRQLVPYEDLTTPPPPASGSTSSTPLTFAGEKPPSAPPAKKRKKTNSKPWQRPHPEHWDDPAAGAGDASVHMVYDDEGEPTGVHPDYAAEEEEGEMAEDEEESRELTHNEIWDDSALIDAWNSAAAEYEAFNGKGKSWKDQPVKKSPLWYNVPPDPEKIKARQAKVNAAPIPTVEAETDSQPIDFNTFVPTHDPSLGFPAPAPPMQNGQAQASFNTPISRDEAFNRALNAMYWTGYWTAIYHSHSQTGAPIPNGTDEMDEGKEEEEEEITDFVSTQR
ncbi:hypothetical protein CONPUDRAFT_148361 [Coniophora puteana RWD-64-598 SS2]|uniref:Survival Motor Neuron Gemin2-binding domain-containing protein n=1 Tax=Coniophora puteana (strain RWD-64-598) TaxID=741705 RepID=A0A5M3N4N7_CONPW|nr:uncharacterized protein CONPUDRAFT_148361 [Coniophora puteana RWD-64-598 SS2]EIW86266.1 hypothetical protein CONPUDRAFT_148361 [Coniophora puteana RWD-64-598 SS2]